MYFSMQFNKDRMMSGSPQDSIHLLIQLAIQFT